MASARSTMAWVLAIATLAAVSVGSTASAQSCRDASRRGSDCPPFEVCSVYLGDCQSGAAPLAVCTGQCQPGDTVRYIARVGLYGGRNDGRDGPGALVGVELVLPPLRGVVSVRGEWWAGDGFRFGPVFSTTLLRALRVGVGVNGLRSNGQGAIGVSAKVEYFPWHLSRGLIPLQFVSVWVDGSAAFFRDTFDDRADRLSAGIAIWL